MFTYLCRIINIGVRLAGEEGEDSIRSFSGNLISRGREGPELMLQC